MQRVRAVDERPPLDSLRALIEESALPLADDLPPMAAGLFGYLGYDMVRLMERLPEPNPDVLGGPGRHPDPPDRDGGVRRREGRDLAHHARAPAGRASRPRRPTRRALARLDEVDGGARAPPAARRPQRSDTRSHFEPPVSNTTPDEFEAMVAQAKDYIRAGDIFQVVLSQRFEAPFPLPRLRALPLAAAGQSGAVPLLSRFRGFPDRLLVARKSWCACATAR